MGFQIEHGSLYRDIKGKAQMVKIMRLKVPMLYIESDKFIVVMKLL